MPNQEEFDALKRRIDQLEKELADAKNEHEGIHARLHEAEAKLDATWGEFNPG